ncbi:MAG TPA: sigma-70 family RNA polymerase sigma factor [Chthonomonadaceae bacterium]|nr:sigma-70 family RNA polymerase sigma factor [Chthonomonadaceae bacterium]
MDGTSGSPSFVMGGMLARRQGQSRSLLGRSGAVSEFGTQDPQRSVTQEAERRRAAYIQILRQFEVRLFRAAWRICGGQEDRAQDLVQDTLIRGYEAYLQGRFEEGTNAYAWLRRILINLFLTDYQRRKRWEAQVDLDTLTAGGDAGPECLLAAASEEPDAALLAGVLDEPLERALAALPAEMRICVVLVDIDGAEYKEASAVLKVPIGTVRSRLARARLQLHALLYDYAHERRRI